MTERTFSEGSGYQVDFQLLEIGVWPTMELPGFLADMKGKMIINKPAFHQPGEELNDDYFYIGDDTGYNFVITYCGLTEDEAITYMKNIAAKLKDGVYADESYIEGFGVVRGKYTWKNKNYSVLGEVMMDSWIGDAYVFMFTWAID